MTLKELYLEGINNLSSNKDIVSEAKNDTRLIFNFAFKFDDMQRILHYYDEVDNNDNRVILFREIIDKHKHGTILQYIFKEAYFMDYRFKVTEGVLCPREDTSAVVNLAFRNIKNKSSDIIELGSGSGIISILLSKSFPQSTIKAIDISAKALNCLKDNIHLHRVTNIQPMFGDMTQCYKDFKANSVDVIISNPPYISANDMEHLDYNVKQEPTIALLGGEDGLDFYRTISKNWSKIVKPNGIILVEIGFKQGNDVEEIFLENGCKLVDTELDICNRIRALCFVKL